jgi:hypothetical protein
MKLQWKEVPTDEGIRGQWAALYVTMTPKGRIALSRVTHEKMGGPKAYVVLFDAANNIIGLKPAHLAARNARRACKNGPHGGRAINVYRLIQDNNLSLPQNDPVRCQHRPRRRPATRPPNRPRRPKIRQALQEP